MPWWLILIIVLAVLFVVFPTIICIIAGTKFLKMLKKNKDDLFKGPKMDLSFYENSPHKQAAKIGREYLDSINCEEVDILSKNNFKLHGWFYKVPNLNTKKFVICFHGFKSAARMEYAPYAKFYHSIGYNMLLVDQRAHGKSEGKYCTMGTHERFDVLSWIDYVLKTYGENVQILLHGVSMGAATVCCASGEDLPSQVKGIISDCAYSNTKNEISFQLKHSFKTPSFPIINACEIFCKTFAKFDFKHFTPLSQVKNAKVPILFVHGEKDCIVPKNESMELYKNCSSNKKLLVVANANHAESVAVSPNLYYDAILELINTGFVKNK